MLGLLLLFFIGKYYYELAQDYYKHRWLYGVLGIVIYYMGTFAGGFIIGFLAVLFDWSLNWGNTTALGLLVLPFGIILAYVVYVLLKKKWKKETIKVKDEIQDIGRPVDETESN